MNIANYDLEDSIVLNFHKQNNNIILKLEGTMIKSATNSPEKYIDGLITLHGVSNIAIEVNPTDNINPHQEIGMFHNYGNIIGIKIEDHGMSFLIRWHNFATHIENTIYYSMNFNSLTWEPISAERETLVNPETL